MALVVMHRGRDRLSEPRTNPHNPNLRSICFVGCAEDVSNPGVICSVDRNVRDVVVDIGEVGWTVGCEYDPRDVRENFDMMYGSSHIEVIS